MFQETPRCLAASRTVGGGSGDVTSDAASSVPEMPLQPRKRRKKSAAKPTYYQRRDEIDELEGELRQLEEIRQRLEAVPYATRVANAVEKKAAQTALFAKNVEHNELLMAGTQSMISSYSQTIGEPHRPVPLKIPLHLPVDVKLRQEVLRSVREPMLQSAYRFLVERTRFLDLRRAHRQGEQFDLANGEVGDMGFQVLHFKCGHSLRQVYEAFMFFMAHQEMSVSEKLGTLTLRDGDESEHYDFEFSQARLMTFLPEGLEVESNAAMFATFVEPSGESPGYGLFAMGAIDQDDLYSWQPESCGRKEVTGALMFKEVPTPSGQGRAVALARWTYMRFRPPSFPMTQAMESAVRDGMIAWCDVLPKVMRERLETIPPESPRFDQ